MKNIRRRNIFLKLKFEELSYFKAAERKTKIPGVILAGFFVRQFMKNIRRRNIFLKLNLRSWPILRQLIVRPRSQVWFWQDFFCSTVHENITRRRFWLSSSRKADFTGSYTYKTKLNAFTILKKKPIWRGNNTLFLKNILRFEKT